jgi:hypothetical protein
VRAKTAAVAAALLALAVVAPILILRHTDAAATPRVCPIGATVEVIGDSITEQSAGLLRQQLVATGYVPQINARGGRTIAAGQEVVWGAGEEVGPLRCWVIALGTNDALTTTPDHYQPDIARLLGFVPCVRGCEPVWWVPVAVAGGDAINGLLPVTQVDWHPSMCDLLADGVHLTPMGVQHWVAQVMAALALTG